MTNIYIKTGRKVAVLAIMTLCFSTISFSQAKKDTLSVARQLRSDKKIKASIALIEEYKQHHPKDMNANWLLAQTLYWDKQVQASEKLYEKTIADNPGNYYLKLDYAKVLVELGETDKALPLLNTYLSYDALSSDALIALAKIAYLKKDNDAALNYATRALTNDSKLLGYFLFKGNKN